MKYDAIVVGAGPAGSTAARLLAREGDSVLLLDRCRFPRDKPCGGGVTLRVLVLFLALSVVTACGGGSKPVDTVVFTGGNGEPLETVVFTNGSGEAVELMVEIADTPEERQQGLTLREHLPEDQGMLFDFGQETQTAFWMKDTPIPLSIAFVSLEGVIVDLRDMEPFSTELHRSSQPYLYAVEANQGWFERNGIGLGNSVEIPPSQHNRDD